jgi:hypothetical protein
LVGCELDSCGEDEWLLRARRRFRWAGELRLVFTGERDRGRGMGSLFPCPFSNAAGPIPDAEGKG